MDKNRNLYIDALKFGVKDMINGISFSELQAYLKKLGWTCNEQYIRYWFYHNFFHPSVFAILEHGNSSDFYQVYNKFKEYDDHKCVITADAYEMLLDFEKLQQARKDTKKAHSLAIIAILITVATTVVQIILGK